MAYRIEYQDIGAQVWHYLEERYASEEEAHRAIRSLMDRGDPWATRAYRTAPVLTHPELVRLGERLTERGVTFCFFVDDDGAEAVLYGEGKIAAAVPGGPVRMGAGLRGASSEVVRRLLAQDRQAAAAAKERERAAAQQRSV
jgi:hypothetical protein